MISFVDPHYSPRYYQIPVFQAIHSGIKRVFLVWHRRAGKDKTCWEAMLSKAFEEAGNYWYMFPEYAQGRKAFWESIDSQGKRIIDYIPEQLLYKAPSNQSMTIYLKTRKNIEGTDQKSHSTIQVVGADQPDSLRGSNPKGVIASEYSEWKKPSVLETIIEPILVENNGWLLINCTPKGKQAAYYLYQAAKSSPAWFTSLLTIEDTQKKDTTTRQWQPIVSQQDIQAIRDRKQTPEEIILQEYYCDFNAPQTGLFYAQALETVDLRRAVLPLTYNPNLHTYTGWDLGLNDATAIWWFQFDPKSKVLYAIDYEEFVSTPLPDICHHVVAKPYRVKAHIAPHDIVQRGYESGLTRYHIARQHGVSFQDATNTLTKAKKLPILDGIEAVRNLIPRTYFCQYNAQEGLECLRNYKRKYDAETNTYGNTPVHDKYSHGADAFRTFAVWFRENEAKLSLGLNPSPIRAILPTSVFES